MDWELFVVVGFPFMIAALGIALAAFRRYLKHKEWMAMIEKGIVPPDWAREDLPGQVVRHAQSSPIVVTLIGVALTLGLLTIGVGPWLIAGLVPTAIGCGMLIQQMVKESKEKREQK